MPQPRMAWREPFLLRSLGRMSNGKRCISTNRRPEGATLRGTLDPKRSTVQAGQFIETDRIFSMSNVHSFACLIRDPNPIHTNDAPHSLGAQPIVHGMLVASLFSSLFGTLVPGCVYRSQSLKFRQPVRVNESVVARVTVVDVVHRRGLLLTCDTSVLSGRDQAVKIQGVAKVWLP